MRDNQYIATCRVCGKQYLACHTQNVTNVFRWQDVACSLECGEEYLRRSLAADEARRAAARAAASEK